MPPRCELLQFHEEGVADFLKRLHQILIEFFVFWVGCFQFRKYSVCLPARYILIHKCMCTKHREAHIQKKRRIECKTTARIQDPSTRTVAGWKLWKLTNGNLKQLISFNICISCKKKDDKCGLWLHLHCTPGELGILQLDEAIADKVERRGRDLAGHECDRDIPQPEVWSDFPAEEDLTAPSLVCGGPIGFYLTPYAAYLSTTFLSCLLYGAQNGDG